MSCSHDTDFLRLIRLRVPVYHKLTTIMALP